MPGCHDTVFIGNVTEIECREVREIDAIVPDLARLTPSHDVAAADLPNPFCNIFAPIVGNGRFRYDDDAVGLRCESGRVFARP